MDATLHSHRGRVFTRPLLLSRPFPSHRQGVLGRVFFRSALSTLRWRDWSARKTRRQAKSASLTLSAPFRQTSAFRSLVFRALQSRHRRVESPRPEKAWPWKNGQSLFWFPYCSPGTNYIGIGTGFSRVGIGATAGEVSPVTRSAIFTELPVVKLLLAEAPIRHE